MSSGQLRAKSLHSLTSALHCSPPQSEPLACRSGNNACYVEALVAQVFALLTTHLQHATPIMHLLLVGMTFGLLFGSGCRSPPQDPICNLTASMRLDTYLGTSWTLETDMVWRPWTVTPCSHSVKSVGPEAHPRVHLCVYRCSS